MNDDINSRVYTELKSPEFYSHIKLNEDDISEIQIADKASADTGYVKAQTVDLIMKMQIDAPAKYVMLKEVGIDDYDAEVISGINAQNTTAENLKKLPPLIAAKITDKINEKDLLSIVGL